ncbi:MAG: hypothetical protein Kapaf2KO_09770 [Candidatus Kapaibacteriales bacterium]
MITLDDFPGWEEGLWLKRVGLSAMVVVLIVFSGLFLYSAMEINILDDLLLSSSLVIGSIFFGFVIGTKSMSPIRYDESNLYYIHKGKLITEPWSNIKPITKPIHKIGSTLPIRFKTKSAIGKRMDGVCYTPKSRLITREDIEKIIELSESD